MEEPYTATTAWHLPLMMVTSLVTHCCGVASHFSSSFATSQPAWLCWSIWHKQHVQADPTSVSEVEVRTAGRPFHPLHSPILEAVSQQLCSVWQSKTVTEPVES